jgi:hypothetical protein
MKSLPKAQDLEAVKGQIDGRQTQRGKERLEKIYGSSLSAQEGRERGSLISPRYGGERAMPGYDEFAIAHAGAGLDLRPTSRISRVFPIFFCDAMAESSLMEPQDAWGHWLLGSEESGNPTSALPSLNGHSVRRLRFVRFPSQLPLVCPLVTRFGYKALAQSIAKRPDSYNDRGQRNSKTANRSTAICGWTLRSILELATKMACTKFSLATGYAKGHVYQSGSRHVFAFLRRQKGVVT